MPQRKSHFKSRRGCLQCKQRHVKCDERTPSCGYCVKREIVCSLSTAAGGGGSSNGPERTRRPHPEPAPSPTTRPTSVSIESATTAAPIKRNLELTLMHHYSTSTCHTMEQGLHSRALWKHKVPELALQHDFLLHALFDLTARHLLATTTISSPASTPSLTPSTAASLWSHAALEHQTLALEGLQTILRSNLVNATKYEAVFACSIFLLASCLNLPRIQDGNCSLETILLDLRDQRAFLMGLGVVQNDFVEELRGGPFGVLFAFHVLPGEETSASLLGRGDEAWREMEVARILFALFDDLDSAAAATAADAAAQISNNNDTENASPTKSILLHATANLRQATSVQLAGGVFAGIVAWPSAVEAAFLDLLAAQHALALAILALYAVVLHTLDSRWWARGAGRRLLKALVPLVLDADHTWAPRITSAFSAVEGWMMDKERGKRRIGYGEGEIEG